MTNALPIAIFDSGVGGLTVANAIRNLLPNEDLIYLGDTARVPYGNRSPQTIRRYALNAAHLLVNRGIKALVIACNTASSYGLDAIAKTYCTTPAPIPLLGVIEPVATSALRTLKKNNPHLHEPIIAVLATRATIKSGVYDATLKAEFPTATVIQEACPLFVPLAEEGLHHGLIPETIATQYLTELKQKLPDQDRMLHAIILGCTHYPLLRDVIEKEAHRLFGAQVKIFDSATSTATDLRNLLKNNHILNSSTSPGTLQLLSTDSPEAFSEAAQRIFGLPFSDIQHVDIVDHRDLLPES